MKNEKLLGTIGKIDDNLIHGAVNDAPKKKKPIWLKWGAMAACLCIVVAAVLALPHLHGDLPEVPPSTDITPGSNLGEQPNGSKDTWNFVTMSVTSETYDTLPELLAYLAGHESHDGNDSAQRGGSGTIPSEGAGSFEQAEAVTIIENTGVAVHWSGKYSYHIGENAVYITRLDGEYPEGAGKIDGAATAIFTCNDNLFVVSEYQSNGSEIDPEMSVRVGVYDISTPESPAITDEYVQRGGFTACWMAGSNLYLVTDDGVCACGYSRLDNPSEYYPALAHNGETIPWSDEDISILGEPTRVQYTALSVINGNSRELVDKRALYGNILKLFYGMDNSSCWLAVTAAGETAEWRDNPVIYTFEELDFTGAIGVAEIFNAPARNQLEDYVPTNGDYLSVVSLTRVKGIYRLLGTYSVQDNDTTAKYFMAAVADPHTGETGANVLSAANYPKANYTEILWEESRVIACVETVESSGEYEIEQETRFIFAEFDDFGVEFYKNSLTADYINGRVGITYGSPLGNFNTLIALGDGLYLRYTMKDSVPGGFDIYDFKDSAAPICLRKAEVSASGSTAFDYYWRVYGANTFGTLTVLPGEEDYFRDVGLVWRIYTLDDSTVTILQEYPIEASSGAFFGADSLGFVVFDAGHSVYYVTRDMSSAQKLG